MKPKHTIKLYQVKSVNDLERVKDLLKEYAQFLREREDFVLQQVTLEKLNDLQKLLPDFSPPTGRLFLAKIGKNIAGCGSLHKLDLDYCEIKRVYVRAQHRGKGIGRATMLALIQEAHKIGYSYIRLATSQALHEAIRLYESLHFKRISAYYKSRMKKPVFMELCLEHYFS